MRKRELRAITGELRATKNEDGSRTVSGLIPYNSRSQDLGGMVEIIAPGAFASALEPNADVLALRDHSPILLMGRTKSKTLTLKDSPDGLRYTINLPATSAASDLAESIDRGDLDSTSFGFRTLDDKWAADEKGNVIRTLLQVELFEVSPCSFAAYPASAVSIRSCPPAIRAKIKKRDDDDMETDADDPTCDGTCTPDADGNCTCPTDEDDDPDDEVDAIRNYIHMALILRR